MPNPESVARDYLHRGRGADRRTEPGGLVFSRHKEKVMRRYLSLAALGAALLMSGCIVPSTDTTKAAATTATATGATTVAIAIAIVAVGATASATAATITIGPGPEVTRALP
jgi:hypothetical protein